MFSSLTKFLFCRKQMESVFIANHPVEYADQNDTVENMVTYCRKITTQDYVSSLSVQGIPNKN